MGNKTPLRKVDRQQSATPFKWNLASRTEPELILVICVTQVQWQKWLGALFFSCCDLATLPTKRKPVTYSILIAAGPADQDPVSVLAQKSRKVTSFWLYVCK